MRPTSREIIENIILAIDDVILPVVEDKQAASSLRSARTLLDHLARRVEVDVEMLSADNVDAQQTLFSLIELFSDEVVCDPIRDILDDSEAGTQVNLRLLQDRNEVLQSVIDTVLRALPSAGSESLQRKEIRLILRAYLSRRLVRERDLVFPAFLGTPF